MSQTAQAKGLTAQSWEMKAAERLTNIILPDSVLLFTLYLKLIIFCLRIFYQFLLLDKKRTWKLILRLVHGEITLYIFTLLRKAVLLFQKLESLKCDHWLFDMKVYNCIQTRFFLFSDLLGKTHQTFNRKCNLAFLLSSFWGQNIYRLLVKGGKLPSTPCKIFIHNLIFSEWKCTKVSHEITGKIIAPRHPVPLAISCCRVNSHTTIAPVTWTFKERTMPVWGTSTQTDSRLMRSTGMPDRSCLEKKEHCSTQCDVPVLWRHNSIRRCSLWVSIISCSHVISIKHAD